MENSGFYSNWEQFKHICKHYNRYFDISQDGIRENLLKSIEPVFHQMETILGTNNLIYRARAVKENQKCGLDSKPDIGPAPIESSKNNRMSPAGISYLYAAENEDTCIKETKISPGQQLIIGTLKPKRNLKIVDLSSDCLTCSGSIYDTGHDHPDVWPKDFVYAFASEISKPISEDKKDIEYVPTQLLSEYIRMIGYDGISYKSSQDKNYKNFTFFCGPKIKHMPYYPFIREHLAEYTDFFDIVDIKVLN